MKTSKYNQTARTVLMTITLFISVVPVYAGIGIDDHERNEHKPSQHK